jgi:Zn ribbon nucleic-acid-binding protein
MRLFNRYKNMDLREMLRTARVYTRTCIECGTHWLLPEKDAVETRRAIRRRRRSSSTAPRNWLSNAKCPNCQSTRYTQHRPDEAPHRLAA